MRKFLVESIANLPKIKEENTGITQAGDSNIDYTLPVNNYPFIKRRGRRLYLVNKIFINAYTTLLNVMTELTIANASCYETQSPIYEVCGKGYVEIEGATKTAQVCLKCFNKFLQLTNQKREEL